MKTCRDGGWPWFELDLLGRGRDAHAARVESVHVLVDSVIPVLHADDDRRSLPSGVKTIPVTSMTDGVPAAWDLFTCSPSIGGEPRAEIVGGAEVEAPSIRSHPCAAVLEPIQPF